MTIDEKIRMAKDLLINNLSSDANVPEVEQFVDLIIEIVNQQMLDTTIVGVEAAAGMNLDEIFLKSIGL